MLPLQAGCAPATVVEQALPHIPQWLGLLVVSAHVPPHAVGAVDGQLATQDGAAADPEHRGVLPVHALPQLPQFAALASDTQAPLQALYSLAHANVHAPPAHAGMALAMLVVQALPQVPQWLALVVVSTHPTPHMLKPLLQPPSAASSLASPEFAPSTPTDRPAASMLPSAPSPAPVENWFNPEMTAHALSVKPIAAALT
jgi:hypothetical protein